MDDFKSYVLNNNLGEINETSSFRDLSSIHIGGLIKYLYLPNSIDALCLVFKYLNLYEIKYFIIGECSNTLHIKETYDGVVISLLSLPTKLIYDNDFLIVSANLKLSRLLKIMADRKMGDLSYLAGIPGTIGGALFGNAGGKYGDISKDLISIKYINSSGKIIEEIKENLNFNYRYSLFKEMKAIIIEAKFRTISNIETSDLIKKRIYIKKKTQPLDYPSLGSIFKNTHDMLAWKIIKEIHLDSLKIGGAMVSDKHSNFIVNYNNADAYDVLSIIKKIKEEAKLRLNIILEEEIVIIE